MRFHLTLASSNRKTGPMPVATSSKSTCPLNCQLRAKVCYARYGPLGCVWEAVSLGLLGGDLRTFLGKLQKIPEGSLWRYGQAGDLPGDGRRIDRRALERIATFQHGRRGFAYTHYLARPRGWCWARWASSDIAKHNMEAIRKANRGGFTLNLSADDLDDADRLADLEVGPVAVLLPARADRDTTTSQGREVRLCAHYSIGITCRECGMCAQVDRPFMIGLPAHGTGRVHIPIKRWARTA
jgi:hypothetical protein